MLLEIRKFRMIKISMSDDWTEYEVKSEETKKAIAECEKARKKISYVYVDAEWFTKVVELRSMDASKVALLLSLESCFLRGKKTVKVTRKSAEKFRIKRIGRSRGLKKLVDAGLVRIINNDPGKYATVELLHDNPGKPKNPLKNS